MSKKRASTKHGAVYIVQRLIMFLLSGQKYGSFHAGVNFFRSVESTAGAYKVYSKALGICLSKRYRYLSRWTVEDH